MRVALGVVLRLASSLAPGQANLLSHINLTVDDDDNIKIVPNP